jgi:large subunit ribosomal protein L29
MKAVDLRAKTVEELKEEVINLKRAQFNERMNANSGEVTNTAATKQTRRTIARLKTVITEKQKGE